MIGSIGSIVTATGALLLVLALVAFAARLMRMGGWLHRSPPGKLLAVQESVALDTRRRLHLVQCGQRQVVLLTGGSQDVVVGWLPGPGDPDAQSPAA
jgi:flagellar protein FliO/FliZ